MRLFHIATDEEIRGGETTDVYFRRTMQVLRAKGLDRVRVVAEITSHSLPRGWPWGILCGVEEAARLLEGREVNVYSLPEGTVFRPEDAFGVRVPVMVLEGPYGEFCELETPLLGLLCQASGVATMAGRLRKLAGKKLLIGFGMRRVHPALAPMVDRASYIGGVDGVSSLAGARAIGREPMGTMPHALIIVVGDQVRAWKAFDEVIPPEVPRVALVDTYFDEKTEAILAAEALKDRLWGVRLDTPSSRRGNMATLIREVRWELDLRGYSHVKILVSGGINDENLRELCEAGADGFGVGTSLSNAPTIDFALDIVEKEGKPVAKRGKLGGRKEVWRCEHCLREVVLPLGRGPPACPSCGSPCSPLLLPLIREGKVQPLPSVEEIRKRVLEQLEKLPPLP
ncbi:MAG: nicotinate phosphoribosyltransferase [Hadesarchaea archaeon]|nr:MAG: nicotinate phosphoribosyltransferase [Hadesarchaea archaeon]